MATTVIHLRGLICEADDSIVTGLSFIEPFHMKVSLDSSSLSSYQAEDNSARRCHSQTRGGPAMD